MQAGMQERLSKVKEKLEDNNIRERLKVTCTTHSQRNDGLKTKGPLIAKHPTSIQLGVFENSSSESTSKETIKRPCRTPSPSSNATEFAYLNKRGRQRPDSPTVGHVRQRSSSASRSRPSSPPVSTLKRVSPSTSLENLQIETTKKRIQKIQRARLYLLQQPGPNSFLIAGDSPEHKFKVVIGPQSCSCGRGPNCIHILFVMLRVFQVSENDSCLWSKELKNFEVESLFRKYQERRSSRVSKSSNQTNSPKESSKLEQRQHQNGSLEIHKSSSIENKDEEEICPICLLEMLDGESLVLCELGCKNKLHHHCITIWSEECRRQNEVVLCPLCRAKWPSDSSIWESPHKFVSSSPIVPLSQTESSGSAGSSFATSGGLSAGLSVSISDFSDGNTNSSSAFSKYTPTISSHSSSESLTQSSTLKSVPIEKKLFNNVNDEIPAMYLQTTSEVDFSHLCGYVLQEMKAKAKYWIEIFGQEVVMNLYSKDCVVREETLHQLRDAVIHAFSSYDSESSVIKLLTPNHQKIVTEACCEVITSSVADPVYKVYIACLKCLRGLMAYYPSKLDEDLRILQNGLKPVIKAILLKCASGNRRTSQLSLSALVELCRGQAGIMAVGNKTKVPAENGIGGVPYILETILEITEDLKSVSWQWILGRLYVLETLMAEFPKNFYLLCVQNMKDRNDASTSNHKFQFLNYERIISVLQFSVNFINHSHNTVNKMSRQVFIFAAHFTENIPIIHDHVCEMLSRVDLSLQFKLKRRNQYSEYTLSQCSDGHQKATKKSPINYRRHSDGKLTFSNFHLKLHDRSLIMETIGKENSSHRNSCKPALFRSMSCSPFSTMHLSGSSSRFCTVQTLQNSDYLPLLNRLQNFSSKNSSSINSSVLSSHLNKSFENPPNFQQILDSFGSGIQPNSSFSPADGSYRPRCFSPKLFDKNCCLMQYKDAVQTSRCPVGDLIDLSAPGSPPLPSSINYLTFKSEIVTPTTPTEPALGANPLASFQNGVSSLSHGLQASYLQKESPRIPGLYCCTKETVNSEEVIVGFSSQGSPKFNHCNVYLEGEDWIRGPLLGTGAFSSCYQARDIETGTLMAVKQVSFCRNSIEEQDKVMMAIREEILMMVKLDHSNIVRILGATQQGSHYNMFVEWMPGGSVATLLDRYGPFNDNVIVKYTYQVLGGLSYLHDNQILHRDLKGANLLVDSTGQYLRIGDFGAAARLASQRTVTGEFQGQLLGTIAFMAPEVLRGEDYGRSCDIWSVGCCIIEMTSTKPPWNASDISNHLALIFKIACSTGPPPVPDTLSPKVREMTLHCLNVNSESRPSAKELLHYPCFKLFPT